MRLSVAILFLTVLSVFIFKISPAQANEYECVIKRGVVFCGSTECKTTSKGEVACGGMSRECVSTPTGNVACGGRATKCLTTSAGNVACGGFWQSN